MKDLSCSPRAYLISLAPQACTLLSIQNSKAKRIRSGVFHQGSLPRYQHPLVVVLQEEFHGAVRENDLVWIHLQRQPRNRKTGDDIGLRENNRETVDGLCHWRGGAHRLKYKYESFS